MACQICNFVNTTQLSVIRRTTTAEILAGKAQFPFTSKAAWLSLQSECPDLRRTHAHLRQGTRPSRKITNIKDVKRYLNDTTIAKDGAMSHCYPQEQWFPTYFWWRPYSRNQHQCVTPQRTKLLVLPVTMNINHIYCLLMTLTSNY